MSSWDFGGGNGSGSNNDSWGDFSSSSGTPGTRAAQGDPFGGHQVDTPPSGPSRSLSPLLWLCAGFLAALAAVALVLLAETLFSSILAWVLGGPIAIGLLGAFIGSDTARRADPWYAQSAVADWGRRMLVVISLVAVALSAYEIADYFARGGR